MKEIRCECGKLLARVADDGTVYVWCKHDKKEVPLRLEERAYEPKKVESD